MTAKKIVILVISLFSVLAVVLALSLFFAANKIIHAVPESVFVQKIDNDFFLFTQFSEGNQYRFKLEQKINGEGDFLVIATVKSNTNFINLSEQNLDLMVGNEFRFSACYATENDLGNGQFCQPIPWTPTKMLKNVDYESVQVTENEISWNEIENATKYKLFFINTKTGEYKNTTFETTTNHFSLQKNDGSNILGHGKFKLYIIAQNDIDNVEDGKSYLPSSAGDGFSELICVD